MLEFEGINIIAIIVCWILFCAVGAFWYSPAGFAKKWQQYTTIDILKIPTNEATRILISVVLSSLLQVLTLAVVLNSLDVSSALHGLIVGLVLWLGLVAATTVGVTLYSRRSWKFLWLNSSYFLSVMAVSSVILTVWK